MKYQGGCHCGAIRFELETDELTLASRCNCTLCTKLGYTGTIVKPEQFRILAGEDHLAMYEWGGKTGQRHFCKTCGVHAFGPGNLPQLGGAYVSINVNCLDGIDVNTLPLRHWDGRHDNWMAGPRDAPWPIL